MQFYLEGGRRIGLITLVLGCIIAGPMLMLGDEASGSAIGEGGHRPILAALRSPGHRA